LSDLAKSKTDDLVLAAELAKEKRLNKQKGGIRIVP